MTKPATNASRLKLATVGCGYFSHFHHAAWQRLDVDHVGVCDLDPARANDFKTEYGVANAFDQLKRMLEETAPDLLDIVLPPDRHLEAIRTGLEAGCHIICQKPFTRNLDQARQAAGMAEASDQQLVVHENFRFQPWYRALKPLIESSDSGRLYQIRFALRPGDGQGPDAYLDRQPYFQQMPEFLIKETGVHFVDVFRYLMGEPDWVMADLRQLNPAIQGEDAGLVTFGFARGERALLDGNRLNDHVAGNRRLTMGEMRIDLEHCTFELDGDGHVWRRAHGSNQRESVALEFDRDSFGGGCVEALQCHVVDALTNGHKPENTARDYLRNLDIQAAIYRSNAERREVSLLPNSE